jgi:hypothetical protein
MPSHAQEKKGGLTLEQLASYDDVITDALVDKVGSPRRDSFDCGRDLLQRNSPDCT